MILRMVVLAQQPINVARVARARVGDEERDELEETQTSIGFLLVLFGGGLWLNN